MRLVGGVRGEGAESKIPLITALLLLCAPLCGSRGDGLNCNIITHAPRGTSPSAPAENRGTPRGVRAAQREPRTCPRWNNTLDVLDNPLD
eukprot:589204-Prorocentrum_minimum.AAC.1